jgi:DNA-directed RNA polymerase subunit beta'
MPSKPFAAGRLLVEDALPEKYRQDLPALTKKELQKLLARVADEDPEEYRDVSLKLLQIGNLFSSRTGGFSPSVPHLRKTNAARRIIKEYDAEADRILADAALTPKQRQDAILQAAAEAAQRQKKEVYEEALAGNNPFALQAMTGSRGNETNVNSLLGSDYLYVDSKDRPIPYAITHSYAEGLTPSEMYAGAHGARKGTVDTKMAVRDAGFLSKQLVQLSHRGVVTRLDSSREPDLDRGLPAATDDQENIGALLARPAAGYARNSRITGAMLADLRRQGIDKILVRSPLVGGRTDGSLYARDVGYREHGRLPVPGENPSIRAVQAISEPLGQGALSCLHAETRVRMGDGSVKRIADIRPGDAVLGCDRRGFVSPVRVNHVFDNGVQRCRKYRFPFRVGDGDVTVSVVCTPQHKFLGSAKPVSANTVFEGTLHPMGQPVKHYAFLTVPRDPGCRVVKTAPESEDAGDLPVFDLEVDHPDHLFVLANGLVSCNSKHSGGVQGAQASKAVSGFKVINQLLQVPKVYLNGATHTDTDGTVTDIREVPSGGKRVFVGGQGYFVPADREITVKPGDRVEAGDVLTDGLPNPSKMTEHKGVGEGRRYFMELLTGQLKAFGMTASRRNVELLARGAVNHVELTEPYEGFLPGDVLPYSMIEKRYRPREDAKASDPRFAQGKYLEKPVLHYSVGTRITPRVAKELAEWGINEIQVHDNPPPFRPEMIRAAANISVDPDAFVRMGGSGVKKGLLNAVHRGGESNRNSTSYIPGLVFDRDFGKADKTIRSPLYTLEDDEAMQLFE